MSCKATAVQNWLFERSERVCAQTALLVVQEGERVKLLACVPATERPDRLMSTVAARALKEKRVLVREESDSQDQKADADPAVCVGYSLRVSGRPAAVVFRIPDNAAEDDATVLRTVGALTLRRAEDQMNASAPLRLAAVPAPQSIAPAAKSVPEMVSVASEEKVSKVAAEQGALLSAVAALIDQPDLEQSLHALACRVAQEFCCLRVYIGSLQGSKIGIRAVSGLVDFDPHSALMVDVIQAMNETRKLACSIRVPDSSDNRAAPANHASLVEQLNNPALMSVPLIAGGQVVGVMMLERDRAFDCQEAAQLERLALLVSPVLALKTTEAMSGWQLLRRSCVSGLKFAFGSRKIGLKLTLVCLMLLAILSASYTQMFRVDADAFVEAKTQRAVISSFPSFLSEVQVRPGDVVKQGDVLAQLDVEELQLDRIRWQGEKEKLVKEYRANLAQRDRSKVRVLEAQRSQAQAKIDLIDAQISRATLRAPIDGVVISGDLLQSLGRPVERGELLFEVASLDNYRLVLHLDEKDIGWIESGSAGNLRLRSLTGRTFPFEVSRITPVSEAVKGANTFRVEATFRELPKSLRPGMEGVAKIEIEPRAVGWIWTRSFANWTRMQIWKFGGV